MIRVLARLYVRRWICWIVTICEPDPGLVSHITGKEVDILDLITPGGGNTIVFYIAAHPHHIPYLGRIEAAVYEIVVRCDVHIVKHSPHVPRLAGSSIDSGSQLSVLTSRRGISWGCYVVLVCFFVAFENER